MSRLDNTGYEYSEELGFYLDMQTWDEPIQAEIRKIEPLLILHVLEYVKYDDKYHLDVRKLMRMGLWSKFESAQRLSGYFLVPNLPMNRKYAKQILLSALGT
jgi:hypothetical protein